MSLTQVDLDGLANDIGFLSEHPNVILAQEEADSEIQQAVNTVMIAHSILRDTNYDLMLDILEKAKRPRHPVEGSVGEFLFGDHVRCYGKNKSMCSTLTLGGIPRRNDRTTYKSGAYPDQIWVVKRGQGSHKYYSAVFTTKSTKAQIYVDLVKVDDFKGFTATEVQLFRDNSINSVEVYNIDTPTHVLVLKETKLEDLVIIEESDDIIHISSRNFHVDDDDDDWNWVWWVLLVLLIVAIILAVIYFRGMDGDGYVM